MGKHVTKATAVVRAMLEYVSTADHTLSLADWLHGNKSSKKLLWVNSSLLIAVG